MRYKWILLGLVLAGCSASDVSDVGNDTYEEAIFWQPERPEEDLVTGDFELVEEISYYADRFPFDRSNSLTLEAAAEIGAAYVLEVLGETLDGKVMSLECGYNPWISLPSWHGSIFYVGMEFEDDLDRVMNTLITFNIHSETHELLSLWNQRNNQWEGDFGEADAAELALLQEVATHYAALHFGGNVAHVELGMFGESPHSLVDSPTASFFAMDDAGNIVNLMIFREDFRLMGIWIPTTLLGESTWTEGDG